MAKKVTIELNETQARTVLAAVEEWFRLRMGQASIGYGLADDLAFMGYDRTNDRDGRSFDRCIQCRDSINEVLKAAFRIAWPVYGTPREIEPRVHVASDIWSTLRYELGPKNDYCSTPFQMGPEPLPKITVEEVG